MDLSTRLSPHFTLRELVTTSHRMIDNRPHDPDIVVRLRALCLNYLEPVRRIFGPLYVSSGYRCPALNGKIGGSKTSAHMFGCAADFVSAYGTATTEIVRWIADSNLDFDQVIDEHSSTSDWVHLGMLRPIGRETPRREALTMRLGKYTPFEG